MPKSIFLSYNSADKDYVRGLAAALAVAGAPIWFDEWQVRPGDSIPGAINEGLSKFDVFVLIWSEASAGAKWVKTELEAAVSRWIADPGLRLIPVRLDDENLPVLLQSIRFIDGRIHDRLSVARQILEIDSERGFRLAVQAFIDTAGLEFTNFWGVRPLVTCPRCGETPDKLEPWRGTDPRRGDEYVGARCTRCGWSEASEI